MDKPRLNITVDRLGGIKIDAENFTGEACTVATRKVEEVLISARSSMERSEKPEMYDTPASEGQMLTDDRM